jgi:hypothetical protein
MLLIAVVVVNSDGGTEAEAEAAAAVTMGTTETAETVKEAAEMAQTGR